MPRSFRSLRAAARRLGPLLAATGLCAAPTVAAPPPAPEDGGWSATRVEGAPWPLALETFDAAWTLIHETHFDPDFNGVDWDAVKTELRPRAAAATTEAELRDVVREMLARLGQSHFELIPREVADTDVADAVDAADRPDADGAPGRDAPTGDDVAADDDPHVREGVPGDVGIAVRLVDGLVLVVRVEPGSPAERAGLRLGDEIRRIGDVDLVRRVEATADMDAGVRQMVLSDIVASLLAGDAGSRVEIVAAGPAGEPRTVDVRRRERPDEIVQFGNLPPMPTRLVDRSIAADGLAIGYIRFNIWMGPVAPAFADAVDRHRGADGIVVDLRGNPGGIGGLAMGLAGHFLAERRSLGTFRTRGTDLQFNVNPRRISPAGEIVEPYAGPVAVLVDGGTASTSELFAGGLQALGRVRVFGETSMGAALPAQMNRLPNGDVLLHAFADFLIADGTSLEGRGVVPDEAVPLDRARLARGEDPPLAAARAWIARTVRDGADAADRDDPVLAATLPLPNP